MGWRTDGTGRYAVTNPLTTWGPNQNVLWSTPLPGWSNATPVPVGDKLFLCAEPSTLLCVSATDGQLLWQKSNDFESIATEAERAQIPEANKQAAAARNQIGKAQGQLKKLKQDAQDKPDDADLKAKIAEVEEQLKTAQAVLRDYDAKWYALPPAHATNGFTSPTPVSDGQGVYTWFASSLVVGYDLEGNRRWYRVLAKSPIGWGPSASPVLVGDKLIVHSKDLYALNKETGDIIWQVPLTESWGTPLVTTVSGTEVLVTPAGDVVRVADGAVLASKLSKCTYCSPVIADGIAYFIENGGKAVRLKEIGADGKLVTETLWTTKPKNERYYASPILMDGLIYCCMQFGVFSVIDASTGEVVYEKDLQLGKGTVYPSVTEAGGLIYVSSDNGTTVVLKPGREYVEVARNQIEPFRASPVFVGNKLFLRGLKTLYCFGG